MPRPTTSGKQWEQADETGATPGHERLSVLIGEWTTSGRVLGSSSDEDIEIAGRDTYEWLQGGHFLIHRVDVSIGTEQVHNLEVIGYDAASDSYPTRFFDHQGSTGTYAATVSDGVWAFATDTARATLVIDDSGSRMQASWEKLDDDGSWTPWMELDFARVTDHHPP